jgi:predicted transport protein
MKYVRLQRVWLKTHPELTERWVQDRIADDPSILGLGEELVLKDKERLQPSAGRLDLLLQDLESNRRYEVEIQLGATNESHIVRSIEYWDIERRRYPQYDHCAVIVAEDITARFLNVISLFNGFIPFVAIQMTAWQSGDDIALLFTKVMDELPLGLDDDTDVAPPTDRAYWEGRATKATVAIADQLLELIRALDPAFALKYNKYYIGLAKNNQPNNFAIFRPKKESLRLELRLQPSDELSKQLDEARMDVMDYDKRWGRFRVRLTAADVKKHEELLKSLLGQAYKGSTVE